MAVTRIWPIRSGELGKVIDYVANTSKTDEHSFSEEQMRDLYNALHYVEDADKTFTTRCTMLRMRTKRSTRPRKDFWFPASTAFLKTRSRK